MDNVSTQFDLWDALKAGNPSLALVPAVPYAAHRDYSAYPGFVDWLVSEYALGQPSKRIVAHLEDIRASQRADNTAVWPDLNKREIDEQRTTRREAWMPLRAQLSKNIENVGVLAKNNRLLALTRLADELEDKIWEERNSKSGQLYLISEYRQVLRQIAEEKGELGEDARIADQTLLTLANVLSDVIKVQGSGVQKPDIIDATFTYYPEDEDEASPVQG